MAKKPAPKKATRKAAKPVRRATKPAARKVVKKAVKKAVKAAPKKAVKPVKSKAKAKSKATTKATSPAKVVRKPLKAKALKVTKKPASKVAPKAKAKPAPKKAVKKTGKKDVAPPPPVRLQRERRRLPEADAEFTGAADDPRLLQSARSGHDELRAELKQHTEAGPEMTAGDVDAKWQDAYALGDEAPGGDNMTPDQDRVDDIGKALGIEYDDDEELQGGAEVSARDESRWELDPDSKEDDEDE